MTATTVVQNRPAVPVQGSRSLWKAGLVAGIMAGVTNAVIFAVAVTAGVFPSLTFQPEVGAQMSIEPVLLVSLVGALAGVGVFGLLRSRVANPVPVFLWVAGAVLLLSFAAPLVIPGTAVGQALVLNLLHIVVAAFVVGAVLRTSPR